MTEAELQAHMKSGVRNGSCGRNPARRIVCADGFHMSVQASDGHYCEPRNDDGPYTRVEVGFPSEYDLLLDAYRGEDGDTDVYGYVPVPIVLEVIRRHGGVKL